MNAELVARCREKLIEVARRKGTITYGELARYLGVAAQSIGKYLNPVYDDLVVARGLPDLTLLAVRSGSEYGRYNSQGLSAQSVEFDPNDPDHRELYDKERKRVYEHWSEAGA